ncbi:MAG: CapA family protein [Proteobacteria bacterium]|nr:CapA family protein [Pseudomonadota bacterium]MCP4920921.1 CapA family protein [Pseudomonadota bacterium]
MIWLLGCASYTVHLQVEDESGQPVSTASAWVAGELVEADSRGRIDLRRLTRPELLVVEAGEFLAEPVVVGPSDRDDTLTVTLYDAADRTSMHFGGDVMLGRRYELDGHIDPDDRETTARQVVRDLGPLMGAAGLSMANLETVVGDLDDDEAYAGKRWLLQTHPDSLSALDELGLDVVGLANNHQRDWLDPGVISSLDALDEHGLPHLGAGETKADASESLVVDVDGVRVGVVAFTSVDGDYVNDSLPTSDDVPPTDLLDEEQWKWDEREWGDEDLEIDAAARRIGDAWGLFAELEDDLTSEERGDAWAGLVEVYPELQDWIARRGHGGAAGWDTDEAVQAITELRPDVDLVVVQLHMGFQFASAPSAAARAAAYSAIDAGADVVIGHHPHVVQGIEWYDGKLVAWSLGNLVFDQDFLVTFRSVVLRTVHDTDGDLVTARLYPLMLDRYRPVPTHGLPASETLADLWEASLADVTAARGQDARVRNTPGGGTASLPIGLEWSHGSAELTELAAPATYDISVPAGRTAALPDDGVVRVHGDALVGWDRWGYGDFEDGDTDAYDDTPGWIEESSGIHRVSSKDPQRTVLEITRSNYNSSRVITRFVARIPLVENRLFADADGSTALDGDASFSLRMLARGEGERDIGTVQIDYVHFDDLDPTAEPWTETLRTVQHPIEIKGSGWKEILIDLDADLEPVDGLAPNGAMVTFRFDPGEFRSSRIQLDEVEFIEWRPAPDAYVAADRLRSDAGETVTVDHLSW